MLFFAGVLVAFSAAQLSSVIVYSESTPPSLLSELSDFVASESQFDILLMPMTEELTRSLDGLRLTAVFDLTFSVSYNRLLASYCSLRRLICFSKYSKSRERWIFGLHPSALARAQALQKLTEKLEWKDCHLISSQSQESRQIYEFLSKDPIPVISSEVDQEVYDLHIGREIKPTGNWKVLAITDSIGASKVLNGLNNLRIFKERCALILSMKRAWGEYDLGTIIVTEQGLEFSKTEEEYQINSIRRSLNILFEISREGQIKDNEQIRELLEQNTQDHAISSVFSIVNYNPGLSVVGNITDRAYIDTIVYPGNVTELNRSPPVINISGNLGLFEIDGSISTLSKIMNAGILPMIDIINSNKTLLSNFVLEIYGTDCGYTFFNYNYGSECMKKHIDHLGAFYIEGVSEDVAEGNIQIFRENKIEIPHIGNLYDDADFYDKEKYPELLITTAQTLYTYSILPYILNSFRWKEILMYYRKGEPPSRYEAFTKNCEILNIEIKNKHREIYDPDPTLLESNKEALREAVDSKCRIFVLFLVSTKYLHFMEALYDLGLRRGDAVVVLTNSLGKRVDLEEMFGHNKQKVLEIADGSLSIISPEYRGEYGENLEKMISDYIYPTSTDNTCFPIDSLLLGVYTIDLMLDIGRNYEDPLDMNYFMRQVFFTGCSGRVSIDSQGNGRSEISFILRNFYVQGKEEWIEQDAGYYTIGIMIPLHISKEIVWPNGSKQIPGDTREDPVCGIKETDIQSSHDSIMITVYGSIAYFLIVFIVSVIIWFLFYRLEIERISERTEIMFEDGVEIATPFIEGLQFIALGPSVSILSYLSVSIGADSLLNFKHEDFWIAFYVFFGIKITWSFCILSTITRFDRRFPRDMKNMVRYFGLTFLPLFSKIGFLVIGWIIVKVFDCKEGTSDEATDAFLKDDCDMRCWQGYHLGISITTIVLFTLYSILSTITCTIYDQVMDHVNIKTNSFFSFQKSMLKIAVLIFHFLLCKDYPLIMNAICFASFIFWTIYCFNKDAFNHVRLIMWQSLISLGVCCHFFVCLIQEIENFDSLYVIILDFVLILSILTSGLGIQILYLPGFFFRRKGRNYNNLLVFAFTNRMNPKDLTEHQLDYRLKLKQTRSSLNYEINRSEDFQ